MHIAKQAEAISNTYCNTVLAFICISLKFELVNLFDQMADVDELNFFFRKIFR